MTNNMTLEIVVKDGGRLDSVITENSEYTRSFIKKLFEDGQILVNGIVPKKSGQSVKSGDVIKLEIPAPIEKIEKKDIPIEVIYQDDDIAIINKPQGLTVHPAGTNYDNTLVNALMFNLDSLSGINGEIRPGIVHRLDKDTSGVMVVAKNDKAHLSLSEQIANRTVKKEYVAIVEGNLKNDEGRVETLIGRNPKDRKLMAVTTTGRVAITDYKVIARLDENCLVHFRIHTGRTHQIRVHCKHLGHPIVG
ncbi:MAG: RluA family pseudouridine synthase, partial [Clostridia bacterium]|nr:RluA family pseudouridine synthase [Clostridia bacterium]